MGSRSPLWLFSLTSPLHIHPLKLYGTFNVSEPPILVLVTREGAPPLWPLQIQGCLVLPRPPPPLTASSALPLPPPHKGPLPLLSWSPRLVHESSNLLCLFPLPHPPLCLALSPIPSSRRTQARPPDLQSLPDPGAGEGVPI